MAIRATKAVLRALKGHAALEGATPARANKYGAARVTRHGFHFDSRREATRYDELLLLARQGEIDGLRVHPKFPLYVVDLDTGEQIAVGVAEMDFAYNDLVTPRLVVEDVKGLDTAVSRLKRRHVEAQYRIRVTVIR